MGNGKPVVSRLRRMPDTLKIPNGEGGGHASFVANGVYQGECSRCPVSLPDGSKRPGRFWVETQLGDLVCPHCKRGDKVRWHWARAQTAFVPEYDDEDG